MENKSRVPVIINADICGSPEFIKIFDGYRTVEEIGFNSPYFQSEIDDFIKVNLEGGKMVWKDEWSPLHWCESCDLPLLSESCSICKKKSTHRVDLKYPCNPRPIMVHDEAMFKDVGLPWPIDPSMVLNAYKLPDYWGWELIYGGKHIGDIIQTHENGRFQFIAMNGFDSKTLLPKNISMEDLVKANIEHLKYIEKEAIFFTNSYKYPWSITVPVLGFSGGKDSVVLAHVVSKTKFKNVFVYQINTGIEPEYNETFSDRFLATYKRFHVHKLFSKDIFWKSIKKLGPHALDFQWCRKVLKNLSIYREKKTLRMIILHFVGRFIKSNMVVLHGARNREEPERVPLARTLKLKGDHPTMPTAAVTTIMPIAQWTDFDVWMYTHWQKLPVNPCYTEDKGQRMLCMFCFEKNDYEFENDMKSYPEVYQKLESELKVWQKKFNFPDEWITKRLWRYNDSNSSYMKKLQIVPRVDSVIDELARVVSFDAPKKSGDRFTVEGKIQIEFKLDDMAAWFKAFGKSSVTNEQLIVKPDYENILKPLGAEKKTKVGLRIESNGKIHIDTSDEHLLQGLIKLVHGWASIQVNCLQCGACVKQTKNIEIDKEKLKVKKKLPLNTLEAIFKDCPVHPEGVKNMMRPLSKEYTPTSCTSCFIKYKKDMSYIEPRS
jgi:3'-phosphoadenosine 5'-phosphosulfate sulfotransferase (PAPS reductase)/FAD synthetase